jgi:hypothetical protein
MCVLRGAKRRDVVGRGRMSRRETTSEAMFCAFLSGAFTFGTAICFCCCFVGGVVAGVCESLQSVACRDNTFMV